MSANENSREMIGGNNPPDYAKLEQERLSEEYAGYVNTLNDLSGLAKNVDAEIPDDDGADQAALEIGALIKRMRDLDARIEETRKVEGEPYLRRKNAVDAFFKGLRTLLQPEDKRERLTKPGWIDRLQARINAHQNRKEAKERARLEAIHREQERIAREAAEKAVREREAAEKAEREAREKAQAAERARKPENKDQRMAEAERAAVAADGTSASAIAAEVAAEQAQEAAHDARIATLATPADLVRTRGVTQGGAGVTLTKAKEKYSILVDRDALDAAAFARLGPFFTDDALQTALNKFARATNYRDALPGCEIGERTKGVTR